MPRDRNGISLHEGDRVTVNTGGDDVPAAVVNVNPQGKELRDCVLVEFENGSRQWMPTSALTFNDGK